MPRKIGRRKQPGRKPKGTVKKGKVVVIQQPVPTQNPVNIYITREQQRELRPEPVKEKEVAIQPTQPQQLTPAVAGPITPLFAYAASSQTFAPSDPTGAPAITPVATVRKCSVCQSTQHVKNRKDHPESYY